MTERGFILPVVLFTIAGLALVLFAAVSRFSSAADDLIEEELRASADADALTVEARLAFMFLSQPVGQTGIMVGAERRQLADDLITAPVEETIFDPLARATPPVIRLDGKPYRLTLPGGRAYLVEVQDVGGLLNLNTLTEDETERMLTNTGMTSAAARTLSAAFLDYRDFDDQPRLGGGEAFSYPRDTPPANGPLNSRAALMAVKAWQERPEGVQAYQRLRNKVWAGRRFSALNVNAMEPEALRVLFNLNERQAQLAVASRVERPFSSLADMSERIGAPVTGDPFVLYTFPGSTYRVRIRPEGGRIVFEGLLDMSEQAGQPLYFERVRTYYDDARSEPDGQDERVDPFPRPPAPASVRRW